MTDYSQQDIAICIKFISPFNEMLHGFWGQENFSLSDSYNARIIYNTRKPDYIELFIFHPSSERLFEAFQFLQSKGANILDFIQSKPIENQWGHPIVLDFTSSKLIEIKESPFWEHFKKPLILKIDNLELLFDYKYAIDGHFQLIENAHQHIEELIHYGFLANHDPNDLFIFSNNNREIIFGPIQLSLSLNHEYGDSTKFQFEIIKDAYLTIKDDSSNLKDIDIIKHGNLLCTLMSLFWEKSIDFFNAHIRINDNQNYHTRVIYKYSNHFIDDAIEYNLKDRYTTIYDFIESLNYTKTLNINPLLEEIVPRIIMSKNVDEISEFMLLYNVIEKIRNYCIINPIDESKLLIKEEFKFIVSKSKTNDIIKNKIKEIAEIVDPLDVQAFLEKASDKVSFIKKTGLIDQFDSLVKYLTLDPLAYDLNFTNLIKIRNDIYHGNAPREDVKPYNKNMKLLVYDLILKLMQ